MWKALLVLSAAFCHYRRKKFLLMRSVQLGSWPAHTNNKCTVYASAFFVARCAAAAASAHTLIYVTLCATGGYLEKNRQAPESAAAAAIYAAAVQSDTGATVFVAFKSVERQIIAERCVI